MLLHTTQQNAASSIYNFYLEKMFYRISSKKIQILLVMKPKKRDIFENRIFRQDPQCPMQF